MRPGGDFVSSTGDSTPARECWALEIRKRQEYPEAVTSIRLAGVGGQGILVASEVYATSWRAGHDVKKSEIHGMAQRGAR